MGHKKTDLRPGEDVGWNNAPKAGRADGEDGGLLLWTGRSFSGQAFLKTVQNAAQLVEIPLIGRRRARPGPGEALQESKGVATGEPFAKRLAQGNDLDSLLIEDCLQGLPFFLFQAAEDEISDGAEDIHDYDDLEDGGEKMLE